MVKIKKSLSSSYLVFVELVESLRFDLFNGVVLPSWNVLGLINFGVFLARSQQVYLLEVLFTEHYLFIYSNMFPTFLNLNI